MATRVVPGAPDRNGLPERGLRRIEPAEAAIVRRIFKEYAAGRSAKAIAQALNREAIAGPQGGAWGPSTIAGNAARGTGILNNELYIGRLVWNRLRYIKDPSTGRRVSRLNDPQQRVVVEVPELRIIDDELWQAVKARQAAADQQGRGCGQGGVLGPAPAALPVLRADALRRLRRRLRQDQPAPFRLLDRAQQGHLQPTC